MARTEPSLQADLVARAVIDPAFEVRKELGAGLTEKAYTRALAARIRARGFGAAEEVAVRLVIDGENVLGGRIDIVAERLVAVEVKAVEANHPRHLAQALTYLRLSECEIALVINFAAFPLRSGIRRLVLSERGGR